MDFQTKLLEWRNDPVKYVTEVFRATPSVWQAEALNALASEDFVAIRSGHGVGKGKPCDAMTYRLELSSGKAREVIPVKVGELKVGDYVFGSDGAPTRVTGTNHYRRMHYLITFDDGSSVEVSGEHEWRVRGRQERRRKNEHWRTLETQEILKLGVLRPNGKASAKQWEIPIQSAVQFAEAVQPIHPYFVGLWLGDGTKGQPFFNKPFPEIAGRLRDVTSMEVSFSMKRKGETRLLGIKNKMTDPVFQKYSYERYIPNSYKYASIDQRMEIFRGLCDSDGEVHRSGSIGYSTASKQLAEDIIWLARSLGCKAMMQPTIKKPHYISDDGAVIKGRDSYRVTINATFNPFTINHRKEKWKPSEDRYLKRWIASIEPTDIKDGMCIEVEAQDHLYQTKDFHVTHNSTYLSWAIFWFLSTRMPCKIPCTAPTGHQLQDVLWSELGIWMNMMDEGMKAQFSLNSERLCIKGYETSSFAVPRTSRIENPDAFQGFHAKNLLFVVDEASGVPDKIFEVGEGAMSTPGAKTIMTGNPTNTAGYFYDAFHKMSDFWWGRRVSCLDVEADYANPKYADRIAAKWGADSNVYRVRVLGEFPSENDDSVIPYYLVEAAKNRDVDPVHTIMPVWGLDVARFGTDKTALCKRKGNVILEPIKTWRKRDTMEVAGLILNEYEDTKSDEMPSEILVDVIGVGAGVVDRMRELGLPVRGINVGESPSGRDRFMRLRDELWWRGREWFERQDVKIPEDEELIGQLTSIGYEVSSTGKLKVWSKDKLKEMGRDSPDLADAFCLTMAGRDRRGVADRYERKWMGRMRRKASSWYTR